MVRKRETVAQPLLDEPESTVLPEEAPVAAEASVAKPLVDDRLVFSVHLPGLTQLCHAGETFRVQDGVVRLPRGVAWYGDLVRSGALKQQ